MPIARAPGPFARAVRAQGWVCEACREQASRTARRTRSFSLKLRVAPRTTKATIIQQAGPILTSSRPFSVTVRQHGAPRRQAILPKAPARTRFAPSPTGHLHIGGLRTALFSYLLAKRTGGQFLLRIEDTDQKRLVAGAEQSLLDDLSWAGLQWDEGPEIGGPHGPYKQSERTAIYQEHARKLLDDRAAYRCFCTPQTAGQGKAAYVTSGCYQNCASLPHEEAQERGDSLKQPFTVRLKQPDHKVKRVYPDLIYGKITPLKRSTTTIASAEDDAGIDAADTILIKSDGTPTYHFANVVDDHLMQITHVIRGSEWMASTPLHYDLYRAFGWEPPVFAHVGLLVDENKAKLSKRNNADLALDVKSMRDEHGVLPETIVNFLALLGWSNPTQNDVMDMRALIDNFDLKFTKGNTMVRMEKLWYLQKHHVAQLCETARSTCSMEPVAKVLHQISQEVVEQYESRLPERFRRDKDRLTQFCYEVLLADGKSYQTATQYAQRIRYLFVLDPSDVPIEKSFYGKESDMTPGRLFGMVNVAMSEVLNGTWENSENLRDSIHECFELSAHREALVEQMARHTTQTSQAESSTALEFEEQQHEAVVWMNKRAKLWHSALMQYLREKLSGGQPGPSVEFVMALLGYDECCRRLGIESKDV